MARSSAKTQSAVRPSARARAVQQVADHGHVAPAPRLAIGRRRQLVGELRLARGGVEPQALVADGHEQAVGIGRRVAGVVASR